MTRRYAVCRLGALLMLVWLAGPGAVWAKDLEREQERPQSDRPAAEREQRPPSEPVVADREPPADVEPVIQEPRPEPERVVAVEVRGAKTVSEETVLAKVQTKPGAPYHEAALSEDIRRIFALGYFTDVRTETEPAQGGVRVAFLVTEKPTIAVVEVKGNRVMPTKRFVELSGVKAGQLYDARLLKEGTDKLKAEYARKGRPNAEVLSQVSVDEAKNAATVHWLVEEGPRVRVQQILVEGNEAFPDRRIRRLLKTKLRRWLIGRATYDERVLEEDLERIASFYRKNGYQDVTVEKTVYEDPDHGGLILRLLIHEGQQHRVGDVALDGNVLFPEHELRRLLTLKPGSVYSREALQEDLRLLKQYYGDQGYINAQVAPDTRLEEATKRVHLTYHITENELAYLNRIDIRGNLRTKDVVIRRELRMYPGEPFNGKQMRTSIDRLYNLGFFEEVNVDTEPTDKPNREDLIVDVKEAKTGSFSFGGGFSSVDRLVGLVELEQRNFDWKNFPSFTGAGQDLRFRAQIGTVRRYFDLSFTEPWILGYPLSFGIDAYNRTRLRSQRLGFAFEEQQRGAGLRLSKEFLDVVRVGLDYQLFRTEISNVVGDASADLKAEEGTADVSVGGLSVSLDKRNNRFDPTAGYYLFSSGDLAGGVFAGDKEFWRLQGGASHFWPHADRFVFESRVRTGIVNEYSDTPKVPIFERFFAGGANSIRGFQERRVGPRDPLTNDPIGGEALLVAGVEEVLTVIQDERSRPILKVSLFYDAGNVWETVSDFGSSFRSGAGVGTRVTTPIGPVRFDIGMPISGLGQDKRKAEFHFNISRTF